MSEDRMHDMESTVRLVALAQSGDTNALERLFERHYRPLRRWAAGRLPTWARQLTDTDDLVQNAVLQTFKRMGEFDPRGAGALQAYLRRAVINGLRDELRRRGRQPEALDLDATGGEDLLAAQGDSPLEQAIGRENIERYEAALARLKTDEREAVIGRIEMGYSFQELADLLGRPSADAARKATERALVRLAEEMSHARE
jgi:RNA polymerase sigma-70 factor (ECF subfamily)